MGYGMRHCKVVVNEIKNFQALLTNHIALMASLTRLEGNCNCQGKLNNLILMDFLEIFTLGLMMKNPKVCVKHYYEMLAPFDTSHLFSKHLFHNISFKTICFHSLSQSFINTLIYAFIENETPANLLFSQERLRNVLYFL